MLHGSSFKQFAWSDRNLFQLAFQASLDWGVQSDHPVWLEARRCGGGDPLDGLYKLDEH